jgi:hypothetical protein
LSGVCDLFSPRGKGAQQWMLHNLVFCRLAAPQRVGYQGGRFIIHHFFDRPSFLRLRFVHSRGSVIHAVNAPMSGARWNEEARKDVIEYA